MHLLTLLALIVTTSAHFVALPRHRLRPWHTDDPPPVTEDNDYLTAHTISLPLDHLNPSSERFNNRYWVNDDFYRPGGPVFLIDNGESDAKEDLYKLRKGYRADIAREFGGLLILWEHRFYGASTPPITGNVTFTPETYARYFRHLTIEQALEDVVVFAQGFKHDTIPRDLSPGATPWIMIGGSYAGARAAILRLRNPDIIHASLASSAPVQFSADPWEYLTTVQSYLTTHGYGNCSADMEAVARWVDGVWEKDARAVDRFLEGVMANQTVWTWFRCDDETGGWEDRRVNLRAALAGVSKGFQTNGVEQGLGRFCDALQREGEGGVGAKEKGLFAEFNSTYALEVYARALGEFWEGKLDERERKNPGSVPRPGYKVVKEEVKPMDCTKEAEKCRKMVGTSEAFVWQMCSEFGGFQTVNAAHPRVLPATFESADMQTRDCVEDYGVAVAGGPDVGPMNRKYGGAEMNPSRVFWTDGEWDPWRSLTPNKMGGPGRRVSMILKGGFHVEDLSRGGRTEKGKKEKKGIERESDKAYEAFVDALKRWLPEFRPHQVAEEKKIRKEDLPKSWWLVSDEPKWINGTRGR